MNENKTIFVSYRREDSADVTGRILDRLQERFGKEALFRDVDSIRFGEKFFDVIEGAITKCDVVLVVIGRKWATCQDASGSRRLDHPSDYVRREVAAALRLGKRLIPVLVENATLVKDASLPEDLHPLLRINAAPVRPDPDFNIDIERLLIQLSEIIPDLRFKELENERKTSSYNDELRKLEGEMEQNLYETFLGNRKEPTGMNLFLPALYIVCFMYIVINMLLEQQFTTDLIIISVFFIGVCWMFYDRLSNLKKYNYAKSNFLARKCEIELLDDEYEYEDEDEDEDEW